MTHLEAIILGFIEGATEFIPVSSSGHLIIMRDIFNLNQGGLAFDAVLQLSASLAIILYFWKDLWQILKNLPKIFQKKEVDDKNKILLYSILVGTIPAIILGLILETSMETVFRNTNLVLVTLILGSLLFLYAEKKSKSDKVLSVKTGIKIGLFQTLALIPGISRSGATISGGLLSGLPKEESVRFSFLLSIPILLGAGTKKLFEIINGESFENWQYLFTGSIVSFLVGFLAIHFLIKYLKNHGLKIFVWYRIILALIILILM